MPHISPFRALRYSPDAGSLHTLIAPPYDVISPVEADRLHELNPANVIRLELSRPTDSDTSTDNRYTRARATLDSWLADHILHEDAMPSFYAYEQEFTHPDPIVVSASRLVRRGFFAALRLTPWETGDVRPHERTLSGPKADRRELLQATATNISPVFVLYPDPVGRATAVLAPVWNTPPSAACTDSAGEEHRLWAIADGETCTALAVALADHPSYIADGHHRYETALANRDEQRVQHPEAGPDAPFESVLAVMVPADDAGLVVLPTHRVIHSLPSTLLASLDSVLPSLFEVETIDITMQDSPEQVAGRIVAQLAEHVRAGRPTPLGLVGPTATDARILIPRAEALATDLPAEMPQALRDLDVTVAHSLLLESLLRLSPASVARQENVRYTRDAAAAVMDVQNGAANLALFLSPPRVQQIMAVADAEAQMPQKSTYFYPKLITGLVMRRVLPAG